MGEIDGLLDVRDGRGGGDVPSRFATPVYILAVRSSMYLRVTT